MKSAFTAVLIGTALLVLVIAARSETYRSYVEHGKSEYPGGGIIQYLVSNTDYGKGKNGRKRCMQLCDARGDCSGYAVSRKIKNGERRCELKGASALTASNRSRGDAWNTYILRSHYDGHMRSM